MANGLTLAELASLKCPCAWRCYLRFREIASNRKNFPNKRRTLLEPQIRLASERGYKALKVDPGTFLPTTRPALIRLTAPMTIDERQKFLQKLTNEEGER